ncbi:hypothetical protein AB0F18_31880 [Streptomyces sp. NPDC029216]|uniref:hypothetical protein n=1 Tax=Streptomyces sp. NPDC029216 TaxID=3154701 RepID=UPI0033C5D44C
MITTEPVGEWFWEPSPVPDAAESGALRALALLGDVRDVLASLGLVTGDGTGSVVLCDRSAMARPLFERRGVPVAALAEALAVVRLLPGRNLTLSFVLPGEWAAYEDSWGTFEVPARWRRLGKLLPGGYGDEDYGSSTEGSVRYAEVRRGERLLGFLWASADGAAGYEPRSAAGDAAFAAGVPWLLRLRSARRGGASAPAALDGCLGRTEDGWACGPAVRGESSLDALQELSGRG